MSGWLGLPPTMYLQIAVAAVGTAIGVFALRVARLARSAPQVHRTTWQVSGLLFLLMGIDGLLQSVFGSAAILAGPDAPVWTHYLRWAPALNYSRSAPEVVFVAVLVECVRRRGTRPPAMASVALLLLAGAAVGAALGWLEGPLQASRHYERVAVIEGILFALWAFGLSAAVLADVVDRALLYVLALWISPLPLNVIWFSWLARIDTGVWVPRPFDLQLYRLALNAVVLAVAIHRWRLARRGIPVAGLAGRLAHPAW